MSAQIAAAVFVPGPSGRGTTGIGGDYLGAYPASTTIRHRPVDLRLHQQFAEAIKSIPPERR